MIEQDKISTREHQLRSILAHIVAEPDLKKVLDLILKNSVKFLNMDSGGIILYHEEAPDKFSYYAAVNIPIPYVTRIITERGGLVSQVISQKKLAILQDFTPDTPLAKMWHGLGFKVVIVAPLIYQDELIGLIHLSTTDPQRKIDSFEEESIQIYAEYAGTAIYIARMLEELRKHRDHLEELVAERTAELEKMNEQLQQEITERKRAEEQLKSAYEQLKTTQAQLVQSAKMASIGQLAGGVAHEINNPLTGVLNNVQLIKMEQEEKGGLNAAEFKELLGIIEESALRCKKITQSLLDFSYASKGVIQPVSLNELVEKVTELIGYEMKRQNIIVQKQFQPDLPKVSGDSQLLQQLIFDIVSNAKWAIQQKSGKEGGTITIKTEYEPESKQVCISISDNGIGIPPENLQRIFEPFFTTKPVGEGSGLGLSIVYNIINEHKGTIEVESKVNEGSTFRVNLPL